MTAAAPGRPAAGGTDERIVGPGRDPGRDRGHPRRLGQTIDELGARLDVRAHARERAYVARDIAVETYRESPPAVIGGALALVGLVAGLMVWRRKRADKRRKR